MLLEHYVAGFGGIWGMLAVGIFGAKDELEGLLSHDGILHGGGFYLFGVQLLACCCFAVWASSCTFILIWVSELGGMTSDLFTYVKHPDWKTLDISSLVHRQDHPLPHGRARGALGGRLRRA